MKGRLRIVLLSIVALIGIASAAFATETKESLMVSPEWLKANLGKVVLIDARPRSLYTGQQGHIPGSVSAEWTYFANMAGAPGKQGYGDIWSPATMAKRLGALGINGKRPVVVYGDAGDWGQAGWVLWILRMSGIENAKILDGGFYAWKTAGGKTDKVNVSGKPVAYTLSSYKPGYMVDTKWLLNRMASGDVTIVDVRTPQEFEGSIRPFQEKRGGHIPTAINFPWNTVVSKDFTILPQEELQTLIAGAGITDKNKAIVLYDTAGVRSAFMTMIFRYAGFKNAYNYDGSWHEWAGNASLDIVQGR